MPHVTNAVTLIAAKVISRTYAVQIPCVAERLEYALDLAHGVAEVFQSRGLLDDVERADVMELVFDEMIDGTMAE